ncbi:sensor histidine kinase [Phnomibacter ginsenosidimutans]|uniref:Signal transduction histidine kinase internal region domain-containing protein n=1 Tax=Phnomibacter ginsenosidimutans TaxID=2676868 RepID=A0A6I6G9H1_9BACT|nr:hypothetical protein GLV81_16290 [Phnomibacter ginsenosidimutans]
MHKVEWFQNKQKLIGIHVLGWLLWFSVPYFKMLEFSNRARPLPPELQKFAASLPRLQTIPFEKILLAEFVQNILLMGVFYGHLYMLKKQLWRKTSSVKYVIAVLSFVILFMMGNHVARVRISGPDIHPPFYWLYAFFSGCFMLLVSGTWHLLIDRLQRQQLEREKEKERLQTELSFLRSQISPHFLFNVLNSMVSMARFQSANLEPALLKLSGMMRYMLYETNAAKVSLQQEINYLQHYLDLQTMRFADDMQIQFTVGHIPADAQIEPMLLIPFVENACKHGRLSNDTSHVTVNVFCADGCLHLNVVNTIGDSNEIKAIGASGIGLANVQRRLDLLYQHQHTLTIIPSPTHFHIHLKVDLL